MILLIFLILIIVIPIVVTGGTEVYTDSVKEILPDPPTTTWTPDLVKIQWKEQEYVDWYNGANFFNSFDETKTSGFEVLIKQKNGDYTVEAEECDTKEDPVDLECQIPVSVLTAEPYSLTWGDVVKARIRVLYDNGKTKTSEAGGDGIL